MEYISRFIFLAVVLLISGCETTKLWNGSSDDEYIKVVPRSTNEDVEYALKERDRKYYCQALYASTYPNDKVCYAKMTNEDKVKNIQIKLLKTPEALALDTGNTIKVDGSVALNMLIGSNIHKG